MSKIDKRTAALISAAGMSTRMGKLKQTLPFGNSTIIEHVVGHFMNAGVDEIVVIAGYRADEIRECLDGYPVTILENKNYATTQMLDSIKIGLNYLNGRCGRCLFTPVDVPAFQEETIRAELEQDADIVFPVIGGRKGHPVLFDGSLIPHILAFDGEGGLRGALESADTEPLYLPVDDQGSVMDADTPEQYEKIREMFDGPKEQM